MVYLEPRTHPAFNRDLVFIRTWAFTWDPAFKTFYSIMYMTQCYVLSITHWVTCYTWHSAMEYNCWVLTNDGTKTVPCDKHVSDKFQACEQCKYHPVHHPLHLTTKQFHTLSRAHSLAIFTKYISNCYSSCCCCSSSGCGHLFQQSLRLCSFKLDPDEIL